MFAKALPVLFITVFFTVMLTYGLTMVSKFEPALRMPIQSTIFWSFVISFLVAVLSLSVARRFHW